MIARIITVPSVESSNFVRCSTTHLPGVRRNWACGNIEALDPEHRTFSCTTWQSRTDVENSTTVHSPNRSQDEPSAHRELAVQTLPVKFIR
jgi:hypothetical protein